MQKELLAPGWEDKWYAYWQEKGFFQSDSTSEKEAYTVVMPPPNITGILHMGHVLNQTVQDVLVRRARMQNKETCWVPGIDHASIATEAMVSAKIEKEGLSKQQLGREQFLRKSWEWKEKYGCIIFSQLKKLGVSCDWERKRFTMDPEMTEAVLRAFVDLYERGYIYRDKKIIHWDVVRKTALSNEEVIFEEEEGTLYYIAYKQVDGGKDVVVATVRPETIFGDVAICVHPEDERYFSLHGKEVYVPLTKRVIPIITDEYVDKSFGTGCLKITPAHDANDYELGQKHGLPIIDIFTEEGKLNKEAGYGIGKDRFDVRKKVVTDLSACLQLVKEEKHKHRIGYAERSGSIIEPRISMQWFVRMKKLAIPAIQSVKNGTIKFYPSKYVNTYMSWMEDIRDWCISRQLWWGQRIPVYYLPDGAYVVAMNVEEAVIKARSLGDPTLEEKDLQQDPDVLDTWFSSWLWPFSVFAGTLCPKNKDISFFYPTHDLVTAPEIIFFWVARMIIAGYAFMGKEPFSNVYFTGIVRDEKRRKMSKSLGNSPDPIALMEKYGVDGVRAGILFAAPAGNDLLFDEKLCEQGSHFVHKIKNAFLLLQSWQQYQGETLPVQQLAIDWFSSRFAQVVQKVSSLLAQFRLSQALVTIYRLFWDDFCGHYLEMIKPLSEKMVADVVYAKTSFFFEQLMQLLHPFMPFITEEIWQRLSPRKKGDTIVLAAAPESSSFNEAILKHATAAFSLVAKIRQLLTGYHKENLNALKLFFVGEEPTWLRIFTPYIVKMIKMPIEQFEAITYKGYTSFVVENITFSLPEEFSNREVLQKELAYQKGFLSSVNKKLKNEQFVEKAPAEVVEKEKKKKRDIEERITMLQDLLR